MFENAIYSVISPEGCATILWRDPKRMLDAAKAMKLSAKDLLNLKVIDEIISEPIGGAHRDRDLILENVKKSLTQNFENLEQRSPEEIINDRKEKFLKIGRDGGFVSDKNNLSNLNLKSNEINKIIKSKEIIISTIVLFFILIFLYLMIF
jgi:acetyl-CoA carboxylase carboxyl transferase subunit alpha